MFNFAGKAVEVNVPNGLTYSIMEIKKNAVAIKIIYDKMD